MEGRHILDLIVGFLGYKNLITPRIVEEFSCRIDDIPKNIILFHDTLSEVNTDSYTNLFFCFLTPVMMLKSLLNFYCRFKGFFGVEKIGHNRIPQEFNGDSAISDNGRGCDVLVTL